MKLSTLEHEEVKKVVLAWRMVKDDVFKAANGAWVENQIIEAILEDDSKVTLSLVDFYRKTQEKLRARILSRIREENGQETMRLACDDGKERVIGVQFVN